MSENISGKDNSPLAAIRAKCIDCSGGSIYEPSQVSGIRLPVVVVQDGSQAQHAG